VTYSRVAIIDDDPINNLICEKVIQRKQFADEVVSFQSAPEALEWLIQQPAAERPELIFLDINLPEMDGWDFLAALDQALPAHGITIYILSSSVSEDDQAKAHTHPLIAGFLIKPLTLDKLEQIAANRAG
jgi:CheY-like chemotaxis protein